MVDKPNPDDVAMFIEILGPFIEDLRLKHAQAMIRTAPSDHAKREDLYVMCRGIDMVMTELKTYTASAAFSAAAARLAEQEEDHG